MKNAVKIIKKLGKKITNIYHKKNPIWKDERDIVSNKPKSEYISTTLKFIENAEVVDTVVITTRKDDETIDVSNYIPEGYKLEGNFTYNPGGETLIPVRFSNYTINILFKYGEDIINVHTFTAEFGTKIVPDMFKSSIPKGYIEHEENKFTPFTVWYNTPKVVNTYIELVKVIKTIDSKNGNRHAKLLKIAVNSFVDIKDVTLTKDNMEVVYVKVPKILIDGSIHGVFITYDHTHMTYSEILASSLNLSRYNILKEDDRYYYFKYEYLYEHKKHIRHSMYFNLDIDTIFKVYTKQEILSIISMILGIRSYENTDYVGDNFTKRFAYISTSVDTGSIELNDNVRSSGFGNDIIIDIPNKTSITSSDFKNNPGKVPTFTYQDTKKLIKDYTPTLTNLDAEVVYQIATLLKEMNVYPSTGIYKIYDFEIYTSNYVSLNKPKSYVDGGSGYEVSLLDMDNNITDVLEDQLNSIEVSTIISKKEGILETFNPTAKPKDTKIVIHKVTTAGIVPTDLSFYISSYKDITPYDIIDRIPNDYKFASIDPIPLGGERIVVIEPKYIKYNILLVDENGDEVLQKDINVLNGYPLSLKSKINLPPGYIWNVAEFLEWDNYIASASEQVNNTGVSHDGNVIKITLNKKDVIEPVDPTAVEKEFNVIYKDGDTVIKIDTYTRSEREGLFPKYLEDLVLPKGYKINTDVHPKNGDTYDLPRTYNTDIEIQVVSSIYILNLSVRIPLIPGMVGRSKVFLKIMDINSDRSTSPIWSDTVYWRDNPSDDTERRLFDISDGKFEVYDNLNIINYPTMEGSRLVTVSYTGEAGEELVISNPASFHKLGDGVELTTDDPLIVAINDFLKSQKLTAQFSSNTWTVDNTSKLLKLDGDKVKFTFGVSSKTRVTNAELYLDYTTTILPDVYTENVLVKYMLNDVEVKKYTTYLPYNSKGQLPEFNTFDGDLYERDSKLGIRYDATKDGYQIFYVPIKYKTVTVPVYVRLDNPKSLDMSNHPYYTIHDMYSNGDGYRLDKLNLNVMEFKNLNNNTIIDLINNSDFFKTASVDKANPLSYYCDMSPSGISITIDRVNNKVNAVVSIVKGDNKYYNYSYKIGKHPSRVNDEEVDTLFTIFPYYTLSRDAVANAVHPSHTVPNDDLIREAYDYMYYLSNETIVDSSIISKIRSTEMNIRNIILNRIENGKIRNIHMSIFPVLKQDILDGHGPFAIGGKLDINNFKLLKLWLSSASSDRWYNILTPHNLVTDKDDELYYEKNNQVSITQTAGAYIPTNTHCAISYWGSAFETTRETLNPDVSRGINSLDNLDNLIFRSYSGQVITTFDIDISSNVTVIAVPGILGCLHDYDIGRYFVKPDSSIFDLKETNVSVSNGGTGGDAIAIIPQRDHPATNIISVSGEFPPMYVPVAFGKFNVSDRLDDPYNKLQVYNSMGSKRDEIVKHYIHGLPHSSNITEFTAKTLYKNLQPYTTTSDSKYCLNTTAMFYKFLSFEAFKKCSIVNRHPGRDFDEYDDPQWEDMIVGDKNKPLGQINKRIAYEMYAYSDYMSGVVASNVLTVGDSYNFSAGGYNFDRWIAGGDNYYLDVRRMLYRSLGKYNLNSIISPDMIMNSNATIKYRSLAEGAIFSEVYLDTIDITGYANNDLGTYSIDTKIHRFSGNNNPNASQLSSYIHSLDDSGSTSLSFSAYGGVSWAKLYHSVKLFEGCDKAVETIKDARVRAETSLLLRPISLSNHPVISAGGLSFFAHYPINNYNVGVGSYTRGITPIHISVNEDVHKNSGSHILLKNNALGSDNVNIALSGRFFTYPNMHAIQVFRFNPFLPINRRFYINGGNVKPNLGISMGVRSMSRLFNLPRTASTLNKLGTNEFLYYNSGMNTVLDTNYYAGYGYYGPILESMRYSYNNKDDDIVAIEDQYITNRRNEPVPGTAHFIKGHVGTEFYKMCDEMQQAVFIDHKTPVNLDAATHILVPDSRYTTSNTHGKAQVINIYPRIWGYVLADIVFDWIEDHPEIFGKTDRTVMYLNVHNMEYFGNLVTNQNMAKFINDVMVRSTITSIANLNKSNTAITKVYNDKHVLTSKHFNSPDNVILEIFEDRYGRSIIKTYKNKYMMLDVDLAACMDSIESLKNTTYYNYYKSLEEIEAIPIQTNSSHSIQNIIISGLLHRPFAYNTYNNRSLTNYLSPTVLTFKYTNTVTSKTLNLSNVPRISAYMIGSRGVPIVLPYSDNKRSNFNITLPSGSKGQEVRLIFFLNDIHDIIYGINIEELRRSNIDLISTVSPFDIRYLMHMLGTDIKTTKFYHKSFRNDYTSYNLLTSSYLGSLVEDILTIDNTSHVYDESTMSGFEDNDKFIIEFKYPESDVPNDRTRFLVVETNPNTETFGDNSIQLSNIADNQFGIPLNLTSNMVYGYQGKLPLTKESICGRREPLAVFNKYKSFCNGRTDGTPLYFGSDLFMNMNLKFDASLGAQSADYSNYIENVEKFWRHFWNFINPNCRLGQNIFNMLGYNKFKDDNRLFTIMPSSDTTKVPAYYANFSCTRFPFANRRHITSAANNIVRMGMTSYSSSYFRTYPVFGDLHNWRHKTEYQLYSHDIDKNVTDMISSLYDITDGMHTADRETIMYVVTENNDIKKFVINPLLVEPTVKKFTRSGKAHNMIIDLTKQACGITGLDDIDYDIRTFKFVEIEDCVDEWRVSKSRILSANVKLEEGTPWANVAYIVVRPKIVNIERPFKIIISTTSSDIPAIDVSPLNRDNVKITNVDVRCAERSSYGERGFEDIRYSNTKQVVNDDVVVKYIEYEFKNSDLDINRNSDNYIADLCFARSKGNELLGFDGSYMICRIKTTQYDDSPLPSRYFFKDSKNTVSTHIERDYVNADGLYRDLKTRDSGLGYYTFVGTSWDDRIIFSEHGYEDVPGAKFIIGMSSLKDFIHRYLLYAKKITSKNKDCNGFKMEIIIEYHNPNGPNVYNGANNFLPFANFKHLKLSTYTSLIVLTDVKDKDIGINLRNGIHNNTTVTTKDIFAITIDDLPDGSISSTTIPEAEFSSTGNNVFSYYLETSEKKSFSVSSISSMIPNFISNGRGLALDVKIALEDGYRIGIALAMVAYASKNREGAGDTLKYLVSDDRFEVSDSEDSRINFVDGDHYVESLRDLINEESITLSRTGRFTLCSPNWRNLLSECIWFVSKKLAPALNRNCTIIAYARRPKSEIENVPELSVDSGPENYTITYNIPQLNYSRRIHLEEGKQYNAANIYRDIIYPFIQSKYQISITPTLENVTKVHSHDSVYNINLTATPGEVRIIFRNKDNVNMQAPTTTKYRVEKNIDEISGKEYYIVYIPISSFTNNEHLSNIFPAISVSSGENVVNGYMKVYDQPGSPGLQKYWNLSRIDDVSFLAEIYKTYDRDLGDEKYAAPLNDSTAKIDKDFRAVLEDYLDHIKSRSTSDPGFYTINTIEVTYTNQNTDWNPMYNLL